ncbi:MAG: hypothetical protein ACI8UO_005140 [Verrucomicrobiales bacterium]|jgi:hypothetical protein
MNEYHFSLIVSGPFSGEPSNDELLDATDRLGAAGCDDALVSVHSIGLELEFDRSGPDLEKVIASAVNNVEKAGQFSVRSVAMDRDAALSVAS